MTNGQNGFTLLEVTMAIAIFSVGLLALASMQLVAITGGNSSATLTEAGTFAADRMEKLLSLDYGSGALDDTDSDGTDEDADDDGHDDDGGNFGLHDVDAAADHSTSVKGDSNNDYWIYWNIAHEEPVGNTKKVSVIVAWNERGITRTLAMQGIKAR